MCSHPTVEKNNSSIGTPRSAEIDSFACVLSGQAATQKHKACVLFIARAVMRRYIALPFAMNGAIFKHRRRSAKDEIDVPLDVAVFEEVTVAVNKQRILPAEKATILERRPIGIYKKSHSL